RVRVHRDDPVASQRRERRAQRRGRRGLADAALEAEHRDLVAPAQRLVDPRDQLTLQLVLRALAGVDQVTGGDVHGLAPAGLRTPLDRLDELRGRQVVPARAGVPALFAL